MPALAEGLRPSLDGLVHAVHRTINTSHKKFGAGGAKSLDQSARSSSCGGGGNNHLLELESDQGSGQAYISASPRRISAQLDNDISFAGQHAQVQVVSRPHSPMRATRQQSTSSPYQSRPVSPMQRVRDHRDIDAGTGPAGAPSAAPPRMWTYAPNSVTGSVHILRGETHDASSGMKILSEDASSGVQILHEAEDASNGVQILREAVPYRGDGPPRASLLGGSGPGSDSGLLSHSRGLQGVSILRARPPYSAAASPAGKEGGGSMTLPHGAIPNRGRSGDQLVPVRQLAIVSPRLRP